MTESCGIEGRLLTNVMKVLGCKALFIIFDQNEWYCWTCCHTQVESWNPRLYLYCEEYSMDKAWSYSAVEENKRGTSRERWPPAERKFLQPKLEIDFKASDSKSPFITSHNWQYPGRDSLENFEKESCLGVDTLNVNTDVLCDSDVPYIALVLPQWPSRSDCHSAVCHLGLESLLRLLGG